VFVGAVATQAAGPIVKALGRLFRRVGESLREPPPPPRKPRSPK
jgi:hypothetical protein